MWVRKSVGLLTRRMSGARIPVSKVLFKRTFLSAAFQCEDSWKRRLETPLMKKCNLDNFYYELDAKCSQTGRINPIDVDIFVNAVTDSSHIDEMQDLVHRLRLSIEAENILDSTHHGFVRSFLDCKKYNDLMTVLNDRLNYGIFPDDFCVVLMFDRFLKEKDFKNAAKVATLQMLQEDFSNPLITYLSLYSCHMYLTNPSEWEKPVEEAKPEEDEEEVKVRVAYLRNPYFDGHFDLTESDDLIGKTLMMIGKEMNNDVGRSYELLGSILFKKFSSALSTIKSMVDKRQTVHKDVFQVLSNCLNEIIKSEGEKCSKEIETTAAAVKQLESNKLISESEAMPLINDKITQLVKHSESEIISQQQIIYKEWLDTRDRLLAESLHKLKTEGRLEELRQLKDKLAKEEEELFFFDREDQLDLEIERKEAQAAEEATNSRDMYDKTSDENYTPPDVQQRRRTN